MTDNLYGKDCQGLDLWDGAKVKFVSSRKKTEMSGRITGPAIGSMLQITMRGDPFSTNVPSSQVTLDQPERAKTMPTATATKPDRKALRREADALGIEGWDTLTTDELVKAVAEANGAKSNGSTKKEPAVAKRPAGDGRYDHPNIGATADEGDDRAIRMLTKTAKARGVDPDDYPTWVELAEFLHGEPESNNDEDESEEAPARSKPKNSGKGKVPVASTVAENGNPFRRGSNLWFVTEELLRGGRRKVMIERLIKRIELHPWSKKPKDLDPVFEMDKRILLTKNILSKPPYNFTFETTGRGAETGTIQAFPPSARKAEPEVKAQKAERTGKKRRKKAKRH